MRIIFIRSNPVNPYPRLEKTANFLAVNGYEIRVLAWDRSNRYKIKQSILRLHNSNVSIIRFGIPSVFGGGIVKNLFPLLKFQFRILKWLILNHKSYDVIHAYDFDTGYASLICASIFKKKLVYDIADYYVDAHYLQNSIIGKIIERKERCVINKADAVIICTEERKMQIIGSSPKRLEIIHNSPSREALVGRSKSSIEVCKSEKIKIVYVGILDKSRLLKEMANVIISMKNCEFHVAGYGKLENYFVRLADQNSNVYYYGRIPYTDTLCLEDECDIITAVYDPCIPNHFYAAPNKFYEALALGKPLIMVRNTGMDRLVEKYNLGEVIDFSEEGFYQGLSKIIKRKDEWIDISMNSKKLYYQKFSWDIMEQRIKNLYINLEIGVNK